MRTFVLIVFGFVELVPTIALEGQF
jgi:hypothetical protein